MKEGEKKNLMSWPGLKLPLKRKTISDESEV
jgi:hypothetical protein